MTTNIDLGKIMGRVQALLAKSESTEFPEEASAYRAKAEQLMREYRIAEENLIATDQASILPETHALWMGSVNEVTLSYGGTSFLGQWFELARLSTRHAGVMMHTRWANNPNTGERGLFLVMVGYSGDLRLAELIYTNARIVFGEKLEPQPDPALSDRVNAYRLRSAGINRDRAAKLIWGETSHARAALIGKYYKEECAARGETPALDGRGTNAELYRQQYAEAFVEEFARRLRRARDAADSVGGALTLSGREERVLEAFYCEFPEFRPLPKTEVAVRENAPAVVEKEPVKKGRQRKPYWETAAGRREMERYDSDLARAARGAGKSAAATVSLDRATESAKRLPEEAPGPRGALEG